MEVLGAMEMEVLETVEVARIMKIELKTIFMKYTPIIYLVKVCLKKKRKWSLKVVIDFK